LTQTWSKESGPGTVTFANLNAVDTTATFSTIGTYILKLTASDTDRTASDTARIVVGGELLLHLSLDDGGGTIAADSSDYGHHGTVHGSTWTAGHLDGALQFDETISDYVTVDDFDLTSDFTVSLWFNIADNSGTLYNYLFAWNTLNTYGSINVYFCESSNGSYPNKLFTCISDLNDPPDNTKVDIDDPNLLDGQWHHYCATVSDTNGLRVYIDGMLRESDPDQGGGAMNPAGSLYLGARTNLASYTMLDGMLDDVRIYSRELDAGEVAALVNSAFNTPPTVSAGADQPIPWPQTVASLDGTVTGDGLPSGALTTTWTVVDGVGQVSFADSSAVDTQVTFSEGGQYVLRLTASDGDQSAMDEVSISVGTQIDYDGDGLLTSDDVDLLYAVVDTTVLPTDPMYDLTGDGQVTMADAEYLVEVVVGTSMADTNLDMAVDILDLGNLADVYGGAGTFSDGDTDGDGVVGIMDLGNLADDYGKTYP